MVGAQRAAPGFSDNGSKVKIPIVEDKIYPAFVESLPTLKGKCIAITGTTSGTGYWCALATVKKDGLAARGEAWSEAEETAFKAPILEQYERQGHPTYASARLWDDGIIDPLDTRMALGLGLSAALNAPIPPTRFGVFRL